MECSTPLRLTPRRGIGIATVRAPAKTVACMICKGPSVDNRMLFCVDLVSPLVHQWARTGTCDLIPHDRCALAPFPDVHTLAASHSCHCRPSALGHIFQQHGCNDPCWGCVGRHFMFQGLPLELTSLQPTSPVKIINTRNAKPTHIDARREFSDSGR